MNEVPEWQKFMEKDDARVAAQEQEEASLRVGMELAAGKTTTPESAPENRLETMYEDFRLLPENLQDQIIKEIVNRRSRGENPKDLISRTLMLTRAYKEFATASDEAMPDDSRREQWRSELDEIIDDLKRIKSETHQTKPGASDAQGSKLVN